MAILAAAGCMGQVMAGGLDLTRLADPKQRDQVVAEARWNREAVVSTILEWTEKAAPAGVDAKEWEVGIIHLFGGLRERAGIAFCLQRLTARREFNRPVLGLKGTLGILREYPAVGALLEIREGVVAALGEHMHKPLDHEERVLTIFLLTELGGPEAENRLQRLLQLARGEVHVIERGLAKIEKGARR
jgi:hypothetical protein